MRRLLVLAATFALSLTVSAGAAPPKSAERFVQVAERMRAALRPELEAAAPAFSALEKDGRCADRILLRLDNPERAEERIVHQGLTYVTVAEIRPYVDLALRHSRRALTELEAIRTRDRALRAGRDAWRRSVRRLEALPVAAGPICERVKRWRAAGFSAAEAPMSEADADRFWHRLVTGGPRRKRGFLRAVKRLKVLGVAKRRARAFDATSFFLPYGGLEHD